MLYKNGAGVGQRDATVDIGLLAANNRLGRSLFPDDPGFIGTILELRIYGEVLSADAIAKSYEAGPTQRLGLERTTNFRPLGRNWSDTKASGAYLQGAGRARGREPSSSEEGSLPETCFEMAPRGQTQSWSPGEPPGAAWGFGDGNPEPGGVNSGLPEGKLLNELSLEEGLNAICRAEVRAQNETALEGDACQTFAFDEATTAYMEGEQDIPALESACRSFYESCTQAGDAAALAAEECDREPPSRRLCCHRRRAGNLLDRSNRVSGPPHAHLRRGELRNVGVGRVDRLTGKHNEAPPLVQHLLRQVPPDFRAEAQRRRPVLSRVAATTCSRSWRARRRWPASSVPGGLAVPPAGDPSLLHQAPRGRCAT